MRVVGRFAPSPTGHLHLGSVVAALASFLSAKSQHGRWLLRIEDVDTPRTVAGSSDAILRSLARLQLHWDGEVIYQSRRSAYYHAALEQLYDQRRLYPCCCSRKMIESAGFAVYPGWCSRRTTPLPSLQSNTAWRLSVAQQYVYFCDHWQGVQQHYLPTSTGDFIVKRVDGCYSYQLAVVVDDAEQGITEVVRGLDLLHATARQVYLQNCLNYPTPHYTHVPLLLGEDGYKLGKRHAAPCVDQQAARSILRNALQFLALPPPDEIDQPSELIEWGIQQWRLLKLNAQNQAAATPHKP